MFCAAACEMGPERAAQINRNAIDSTHSVAVNKLVLLEVTQ